MTRHPKAYAPNATKRAAIPGTSCVLCVCTVAAPAAAPLCSLEHARAVISNSSAVTSVAPM